MQGQKESQLQNEHQADCIHGIGQADEKDVHFCPQSGVIEMRENIGKEAWKDGQEPKNGITNPIGAKQMHPTLGAVGDAIGG